VLLFDETSTLRRPAEAVGSRPVGGLAFRGEQPVPREVGWPDDVEPEAAWGAERLRANAIVRAGDTFPAKSMA
jgi:hypothetical protein